VGKYASLRRNREEIAVSDRHSWLSVFSYI
jgi:hypothetical protein